MKKFCISILVFAIIFLSATGLKLSQPKTQTEYLRIHIRANSNSDVDQAVKYKVKDAVVKFLTPFIAECDTKQKAEKMLNFHIDGVCAVANRVLKENGFEYTSDASVKREQFPTRVYGDLELEKGFYDALIVELGDAKGDNWWCVVYPPLCFTGGECGYVYKSKIKDLIDDFFKKENDI
jgi:stage II sporulation protein R